MKTKFQSQTDAVRSLLHLEGSISRNYCLRTYLTSRLGAIIYILKQEGYKFDAYFVVTDNKFGKSKDFVYKLTAKPKKITRL